MASLGRAARNPLLLLLKELESLERLMEKVGRIDLHAGDGQGFDALLNKAGAAERGRARLNGRRRRRRCGGLRAARRRYLGARHPRR